MTRGGSASTNASGSCSAAARSAVRSKVRNSNRLPRTATARARIVFPHCRGPCMNTTGVSEMASGSRGRRWRENMGRGNPGPGVRSTRKCRFTRFVGDFRPPARAAADGSGGGGRSEPNARARRAPRLRRFARAPPSRSPRSARSRRTPLDCRPGAHGSCATATTPASQGIVPHDTCCDSSVGRSDFAALRRRRGLTAAMRPRAASRELRQARARPTRSTAVHRAPKPKRSLLDSGNATQTRS